MFGGKYNPLNFQERCTLYVLFASTLYIWYALRRTYLTRMSAISPSMIHSACRKLIRGRCSTLTRSSTTHRLHVTNVVLIVEYTVINYDVDNFIYDTSYSRVPSRIHNYPYVNKNLKKWKHNTQVVRYVR